MEDDELKNKDSESRADDDESEVVLNICCLNYHLLNLPNIFHFVKLLPLDFINKFLVCVVPPYQYLESSRLNSINK